MRWNILEDGQQNRNPAHLDYRFSINNFRIDQVRQITAAAHQASGNDALKVLLREELKNQGDERKKFYDEVRKRRFDKSNRDIYKRILEKLHIPIPERWLNFFLGAENHDKIEMDFRRWQPPADINEVVRAKYPVEESLAALQPGAVELSGLERLKRAFFPSYFIPNYIRFEPSHTFNRDMFSKFSLQIGCAVGMIMAYSYGRQYMREHDQTKSGNIYLNKSDYLRTRYDSFFRGYTRYAFRWGWRYTFLAGSMYLISQGLCIYRLKESPSHYIAATTISSALYKWTRGIKGMLVYGFIGGLMIGVPVALLANAADLNPRAVWYDASVLPELYSKHHWNNWSEAQHQLSEKRLEQIIDELKRPEFNVINDENLYEVFIPKNDIS